MGLGLAQLGVETEGLLDYQGRAVIISIVRWKPVIFGVGKFPCKQKYFREFKRSALYDKDFRRPGQKHV